MSAPCAICGRTVPGDDHVKVDVEKVPPEERPRTYYFHKHCYRTSCGAWERGL